MRPLRSETMAGADQFSLPVRLFRQGVGAARTVEGHSLGFWAGRCRRHHTHPTSTSRCPGLFSLSGTPVSSALDRRQSSHLIAITTQRPTRISLLESPTRNRTARGNARRTNPVAFNLRKAAALPWTLLETLVHELAGPAASVNAALMVLLTALNFIV